MILALFEKREFTTLLMFTYTRLLVPVIPRKCAESAKTRRELPGCPEVSMTKTRTSMRSRNQRLSRTGITKVT
jgi:hypothetical protein